MASFRVLGHRGAILPDGPFYQNTQAAFTEALTYGDGFETDACASRDGDVFLIHEAKYVKADLGVEYCLKEHLEPASQTLLANRKLEELGTADARQLRLHDGAVIPELAPVMQQVAAQPDKVINIELKSHEVLTPVLRTLQLGLIPRQQVILSSFNHPSLVSARVQAPDLEIGAIFVAADTASAPLFPWHPGSTGEYHPFNAESLSHPLLQKVRPDYIVLPDIELNMNAIELVLRYLPQARIFAWVFTERGGTDPNQMLETVAQLAPTGKLAGLMVDNPQLYAAPLRAAAGE